MDEDQLNTVMARMEKGTQTEDPDSAPVPVGSSNGTGSQNGTNPNGPLADGEAGGDIEKQKPKDYDEETMLVQWSSPNDPVSQHRTRQPAHI